MESLVRREIFSINKRSKKSKFFTPLDSILTSMISELDGEKSESLSL
jgi:hypothetical protein